MAGIGHRKLAIAAPVTAIICLAAVALSDVAIGAKGDMRLVSRQSLADGGDGANSWSYGGSISNSGRFVAFRSEASNLGVHGSGSFESTVYVQDLKRRIVETVSRESNLGPGADGHSHEEQISGNGRFVAFTTDAQNLGGPIVATTNVYVYDRERDRVELISRRSKSRGGGGANESSRAASISADGRYVSFQTDADNLVAPGGPKSGDFQVYIRDRKLKRTFLVSVNSRGRTGNENSFDAKVAARAPVIAFATMSTNLGGPTHKDSNFNVYAHNWKTGATKLVSRRSGGGKGARGDSAAPDLTARGRQVLFLTTAKNLGGPLRGPAGIYRAYVHSFSTGKTTLVSRQSKRNGGKGANDQSGSGAISDDGRYVAFGTSATNLGGPIAEVANVYVYDRKRKKVILASRAPGGGAGADTSSGEPAIAGASPFVTFTTDAMNIDPPGEPAYHGNFPPATNVYRFQFAG